MTIDSAKTWIPIGRRHEQNISLVDAYSEVFAALSWADGHCPMPVADTIIFNRLNVSYYSYDWPQQRLLLLDNFPSPTAAVKTFMSMDEGTSISAVWLTEVKDTKGYLICVEYLTLQGLSSFFQTGDTKKIGVLQRYIYPRPFRLVDDVAQEILVHYNHDRRVTVERRLGNHPLDSTIEHPTVRGNLFHPVPMFGKVNSRQPPFTPAECHYTHQGEHIYYEAFVDVCNGAARYIATALERYRRTAHDAAVGGSPDRYNRAPTRPVSSMTLQFRQSLHDSQLYFISIIALRHPADRYHVDVHYEMIKLDDEQTVYIKTPLSPGELVVPDLTAGGGHVVLPPTNANSNAAAAPGQDDEEEESDEDDPNRYSVHRRPVDPDLFTCPNCDSVLHRDAFVRLEYGEIFEYYLRQCSAEHAKTLKRAQTTNQPQAAADVYSAPVGFCRPSSATTRSLPFVGRSRPQSARTKGGPPMLPLPRPPSAAAPSPTFILSSVSEHVKPPRVLEKLSVPVAELAAHPIRLRTTPLCSTCATLFGAVVVSEVDKDSRAVDDGRRQLSPPRSVSPHDRFVAEARARLSQQPPTCLRSDVIDQMVITPLQEQHRWLRQAERVKYTSKLNDVEQQQRDVEQTIVVRSAHDEEAELNDLIGAFHVTDTMRVSTASGGLAVSPSGTQLSDSAKRVLVRAPHEAPQMQHSPPGATASTVEVLTSGPDMPLHILLQNDLYYKILGAISVPAASGADTDMDAPQGGEYDGMLWTSSKLAALPRPKTVVDRDCIEPPAAKYKEKIASTVRHGKDVAWAALRKTSTTFAYLSEAERNVLALVIGEDPSKALGIDEY